MQYKGFTLDPFQEQAIQSIENNHSVVVSAPTGSGKTLIADYIINKYIDEGIKIVYTDPIKALSNQKYREFSEEYGKDKIGLLTGDIVINPEAKMLIMTTEIYRNMALSKDIDNVAYVIFDEIHYINDIERGYVWEESIIFSKPETRFLCLSATIPNADEFAEWIQKIKKHSVDVVKNEVRNVPLHCMFYDAELGIASLEDIKEVAEIPEQRHSRGRQRQRHRAKKPSHIELIKEIQDKLPCFFFTFSRKECQEHAFELANARIFQPDSRITSIARQKLSQAPPEINGLVSTKVMRHVLPYGIAFHHAGLLPIMKELVEDLFSKGLIKVLYTTETFAVGINMPAKTVCFQALRKFDGMNFRYLNSKEYFQIAGRAGRRGIDREGFSYAMIDKRDFSYSTIKRITSKDIDPIKSQFRLSINTVLNLIKNHDEQEQHVILSHSFYNFQRYGKDFEKITVMHQKFQAMKSRLEKMGYVKDSQLTEKGVFCSRIYSDEILTGELFATPFYNDLNEYQILLLLACIAYEGREMDRFYKIYKTDFLYSLKRKIKADRYLSRFKKFISMEDLTALIDPCYSGKDIFAIIKNSTLLEGDLIRFFRQILDRVGQIKNASQDIRLRQMMGSIQGIILNTLKDVDGI